MPTYITIIETIAVLLSVGSYIPYLAHIFRKKTKPHAFSWLVWSLLTGIAFAAQLSKGGGAGSWVLATTSLSCIIIFVLSLFYGEKQWTTFDWLSLTGAFLSLALWGLTKDPTSAVILITLTDIFGVLPTIRKSFHKPHEETASSYGLASIAFFLSLFVLGSYNLATVLYPAAIMILDGGMAIMLMIRRKQLQTS